MVKPKPESEQPEETPKSEAADDTFLFMGTRIPLPPADKKPAAQPEVSVKPGAQPPAAGTSAAEKPATSAQPEPVAGASQMSSPAPSAFDFEALSTAAKPTFSGRKIFTRGAVVLLLAVVAIVAWIRFGSLEARILRAAHGGQLVMPEGSSAYDLYKRLKAGGLIPMTRDRLNAEVLPKLVAQGDALLKQRYQGTDLTSSEMDELVRIYEWAADLNSQDEAFLARLNYAAGFRALSKGSDQEALTELQRAIRNDSQWALPFYDLARFYARLGNDAYAMYYYQQATQLDPGWVAPQLNLARLHFDADRLGEAELAYRQAAQADPTLATPWYFLGQVYQRQKRKVEAAAAFEKAIELAQQNPPAGFSMEQVRSLLDETRRR